MLQSEKRSLIRFVVIYLFSTFLLFSVAAWMFYVSSRNHIVEKQLDALRFEAKRMRSLLRQLHQSDDAVLWYPRLKGMESAIFDLDKRYIFGSFPAPVRLQEKSTNDTLRYVERVDPYYLGAAYVMLSAPLDKEPIGALRRTVLLFMGVGGLFFSVVGFFLGKLFVAPMRESIRQVNRFIQDATHELNTPISTILTNIELIHTLGKCQDAKVELKRIDIASRTLSRIYEDLAYLNLDHTYHRNITTTDIGSVVNERVEYFKGLAGAKGITVQTSIDNNVFIAIDRNDAIRMIDNILSNAVKYNNVGGTLRVKLDRRSLSVSDTGKGISREDMKTIVQRFKRVDSSEGGFGIGLDIVSQVVDYYGYRMQIESTEDQGTTVRIVWGS